MQRRLTSRVARRPANVLLCARLGRFHLLSSSGTLPFRPEAALPAPLRRRRWLSGADRLQPLGLARVTLAPSLAPPAPVRSAASPGTLVARLTARGRSPCDSERASSEMPGCGHASCSSARGSVPPRPLSRPGGHPLPADRLACDASVRKPVGGPPALRSRRGRSRRVTFHPYKGEKGAPRSRPRLPCRSSRPRSPATRSG
jgi:hypothetical protein